MQSSSAPKLLLLHHKAPVLLGGSKYYQKVKNLFGSNLIAYWPLWEASGSTIVDISGNGRNGAYGATTKAPTLGQPGVGDGRTSALFDGGDFGSLYTAGLAGAFNGVAGTIMIWGKVSGASAYEDGVQRFLIRLAADASNNVTLEKRSTNNTIRALYTAGGTAKGTSTTFTSTAWFHYVITWDRNAGASGQVLVFINGLQDGTTQTALGDWSGSLGATTSVLGALNGTPSNGWNGWLAHILVLNRAATPTEVAQVQSFFG